MIEQAAQHPQAVGCIEHVQGPVDQHDVESTFGLIGGDVGGDAGHVEALT